MKRALFIFFILLIFFSTGASGQGRKERHNRPSDTLSVDSVEYELLILDPGFETWLINKPSKEYFSKEYYEYKNKLYVPEWNYRYSINKNQGEYDSYIDYDPKIDYGLDLNYQLYYYFKYFEETRGTKLYPGFR